MKQLRYLEEVSLYKNTYGSLPNGSRGIINKELIGMYNVQVQELTDEVSATIYGSNINKMYRMSSVNHSLERYLSTKMTPLEDNITKYTILYLGKKYAVRTAKKGWIDVEFYDL